MNFSDLNNRHAGQTAVVIGKGPSLDAWIAAGCPQPDNSVRVGVNQVARVVPEVPYSVSGDAQMDMPEHLALPTQWLRAVPYFTRAGEVSYGRHLPLSVLLFHCRPDDPAAAELCLQSSREELARLGWLFGAHSSANNAVHLAWYLGCTDLLLVGIDGGPGRAQIMQNTGDRSGPPSYDQMRDSVREQAQRLFPFRWRHWEG